MCVEKQAPNDDYGKGGYDGVVAAASKYDGVEVFGESFATDDTDMTAQLSTLKSEEVDALFIWANYTPGSYCMKQARALDWDVQFYAGIKTIFRIVKLTLQIVCLV